MSPQFYSYAAGTLLVVHAGIVLFNTFGLIAIPLGAWLRWSFVRVYWWRLLHVILMAGVAFQAYLGRACFLTLWQAALEQRAGEPGLTTPLVQRWIEAMIFWPLPAWVFALIYSAALASCLALWWLVPPVRTRRPT